MQKDLWPHQEARRILKACHSSPGIILETGYGPSGAPHIGTFAEVARTSWVGAALKEISGKDWTLIAFSDDMDGLRKVPLNMPAEALEPHLGKPLSHVPDPFGCHGSYGEHNNARLREMLDRFGFRYTFRSSHQQYTSGAFNEGLSRIMASYEKVRGVILPTIREEKRSEWSPFFPICEGCGRINSTRVTGYDARALTVSYICEGERAGALGDEPSPDEDDANGQPQGRPSAAGCGHRGTVGILDGRVKVGWKVDWALRWYALGVQYEMYGKDLIESAALSTKICRIIGGPGSGPVQSFYEMFLDEEGRKISKSIGRGLTVDTWLTCAPKESLLLFIFKDPRKAKRLSWDTVARSADEYIQILQRRYREPRESGAPAGEIDFIQPSLPPDLPYAYPVSYSMLVGLVAAIGVAAPDVVKGYVQHYKGAIPGSDAALEALIEYATAYVRDHVLPSRQARQISAGEEAPLKAFADRIDPAPGGAGGDDLDAEVIQSLAFETAKQHGMEPKDFFRLVYNVLNGQDSGPRLGSFVKLMGQAQVAAALRKRG